MQLGCYALAWAGAANLVKMVPCEPFHRGNQGGSQDGKGVLCPYERDCCYCLHEAGQVVSEGGVQFLSQIENSIARSVAS